MRNIQNFITEKLTLSKGSVSKKEPMDELQDLLDDFDDKNVLIDTEYLNSDELYDDFVSNNYDDPSDAPDKYSDEYGDYLSRIAEMNWDDFIDNLKESFDKSGSPKILGYQGLRHWIRSQKHPQILPDEYTDITAAIEAGIKGSTDYKVSINDDKKLIEVVNKDHDGTSYFYIIALTDDYADDYDDWSVDKQSKINYGDPLQVFLKPEISVALE